MLFKLAIRNLIRRGFKSWLLIGIASFGVSVIIITGSLSHSILTTYKKALADEYMGDYYLTASQGKYKTLDYSNAVAFIPPIDNSVIEGVERLAKSSGKHWIYSPVVRGGGFIYFENDSQWETIFFSGIDAARGQMLSPAVTVVDGTYLTEQVPSTLISKGFAERRHIKIGDKLILFCNTLDGMSIPNEVTVAGIYEAPIQKRFENEGVIFVSISTARTLLGASDSYVTDLTFKVIVPKKNDLLVNRLEFLIRDTKNLSMVPAENSLTFVGGLIVITSFIGNGLAILILFVSLLAIYSSQLAIVVKRKVEMGTMLAMGAKDEAIVMLFGAEALIEAIFSYVIGSILASFIFFVSKMEMIPSGPFEILFLNKAVNLDFSMEGYVIAFGSVLFTILAASVYPALKASRISPIEVLKDS